MKKISISLILFLMVLLLPAQEAISIDNIHPRKTIQGDFIDAHDGRIIQFEGQFYWYGTAYGNTNGFQTSNHYICYRSPDMVSWEFVGKLLPDAPEGVYYRPHVIYNSSTQKYVLWYNWYPKLWTGKFGVATADRPEGPFEIQNKDVQFKHSEIGLGDFGLMVDDDQTAYMVYNTIAGHKVSIEKLSADYLSSTMENGGFLTEHSEAGSMFKRDGKYYLLTDYTCCFCNQGSGARVYISDHPMQGYRLTNNINRFPGEPATSLSDGIIYRNQYEKLVKKEVGYDKIRIQLDQSSAVAAIRVHVFTGNRKGQCGEVDNPRVHEVIQIPRWEITGGEANSQKIDILSINHDAGAMINSTLIRIRETQTAQLQLSVKLPFELSEVRISEVEILDKKGNSLPGRIFIDRGQYRPIIPAQQTYVMELQTDRGREFLWMGDMWGSAPDNIKGHDIQYWSSPLRFDASGWIQPLRFEANWTFFLPQKQDK